MVFGQDDRLATLIILRPLLIYYIISVDILNTMHYYRFESRYDAEGRDTVRKVAPHGD